MKRKPTKKKTKYTRKLFRRCESGDVIFLSEKPDIIANIIAQIGIHQVKEGAVNLSIWCPTLKIERLKRRIPKKRQNKNATE